MTTSDKTTQTPLFETAVHIPVLLNEVMVFLQPHEGGRYLDGTLGLGGHSGELLRRSGGKAFLCGLDRDPQALALARQNLSPYIENCHFFCLEYANFMTALDTLGWSGLDGALIDIGVSSLQLDKAERGFSYAKEAPLDMRMDMGRIAHAGRPTWTASAHSVVNCAPQNELANLIRLYGEDPLSRQIAEAIVRARQSSPIETTTQLADIIYRVYPAKWKRNARNHPATRTFQAIRIVVNDEIGQLERFLDAITSKLNNGARLAVITFHSIEDRIVKQKFNLLSTNCICPPYLKKCICGHKASARLVTKKPVVPSQEEINANPRAGSAKLRVIEKIYQP